MNLNECFARAFTDAHVSSNTIQQHEWEIQTFLALVREKLKPERTVELGTYKGWNAALLSWSSGKTVSVDIEDHGSDLAASCSHNLTRVIMDACNPSAPVLVAAALGGPIDLLFIDDGHYYETICRELELWKPLVRPGGWIAFHDINPLGNIGPNGTQPDCIQVPRFWKELQGDKVEIIATDEHRAWKGVVPHGGIGILKL